MATTDTELAAATNFESNPLNGPNGEIVSESPPSHVSAGLHINLIADSSVANAPPTFASEIRQAADIIEASFSDPITLNIRYGWGTYNNQVDPALIGGNFAEGGDNFQTHQVVAYSTLRSWLTSDASSTQDNAAVAHLPSTLANNFYVSSAQLKALGHFSGNSNDIDGFIGWGTAWTSNFIDGALHELTHAMGRIFQDGYHYVMDLFRYDAPGHFQWTGRQPGYLSIDGGATKLADFGVSTDFGDFLPNGVQGPDPFNERVAGNNQLTPVDITNMDIIGFNRASGSSGPPPDDYANSLSDLAHPFGALGPAGTATGTLEVAGDHDWFRVQLVAGTSYQINLQGQQAGAGTLADPYLRVHNSAGTLVAENDDIVLGSNRDSQLTYVAPASGTYYLDAGAFNEGFTGTYRISMTGNSDDFANSLSDASHPFGQITVGGTATGNLEVTGDRDWFRVQLVGGTNYLIDLQGEHSGGGTLEDPYLRIHDANGALLAENDDIVLGINRDSELTFRPATTGTYYLEAGAFADNYLGTYRVSVGGATVTDDFRDSLTDTTVPFGQVSVNGSSSGNLETTGDRDWFQVQLTAGTSYVMTLQGQNAGAGSLEDPYLRLHNGSGALLAENDDISLGVNRDSQLTFTATTSGTYYLEAGAFADNYTGTYRVGVSLQGADDYAGNAGTTGHAIVDGVVGGNLEITGDRDWFQLQMSPGIFYAIELEGAATHDGTLADPYLRLYNGASQLVAEDDDSGTGLNSALSYSPAAIGTYFIAAGAFADSGSGTYHVQVTTHSSPVPYDFNGDGYADALFRNNATGDFGYTDVHHDSEWHLIGPSTVSYHIAGVSDFNRDGFADVLFRDDGTGDFGYTDVHNNSAWHDIGPSTTSYIVAGVADFNNDGFADVLYRNNATGDFGYTDVHNNSAWHDIGPSTTSYTIADARDFNADGFADVLFRDPTTGDFGYTDVHNHSAWHDIGPSTTSWTLF
jgi:Bacterial pre-peptidase C-terminal domain